MVEHQVHAPFAGEAQHLLLEVLLLVVDHHVGAQGAGALQLGVAAGRREHRCPDQLGDLDARDAHPCARRVDQHRLARTHVRLGDQHVPGAAERGRKRRAFFPRHVLGHRDEVPRGQLHVLRVGARQVGAQVLVVQRAAVGMAAHTLLAPPAGHDPPGRDPLAAREADAGVRIDLVHLAGEVGAQHVRKRAVRLVASLARHEVERVGELSEHVGELLDLGERVSGCDLNAESHFCTRHEWIRGERHIDPIREEEAAHGGAGVSEE